MIMTGMLAAAAAIAAAAHAGAGSEYERYFGEMRRADEAADAAWDSCATRESFDARRAMMRRVMMDAVGPFPGRTPLNAEVRAVVQRDGYSVEKILFESRPRFHVTALVFVPDAARFKPPYPAILVPCGHSVNGKASAGYQRACVMGAKEGFIVMIYDPIDQGERRQRGSTDGIGCWGHDQFGSKAMSLGLSAANFRIWDGMRAIDYLVSRPDVKADRIGCMGNSGGGTLTAYLMALDGRIKAASPSCYISSIRDVVESIGPQDAEQCLYGQLAGGLNHASLVLAGGCAVRLQFSEKDFFPLSGAKTTFDVVKRTAARFGLEARYDATIVPGPHGWKESSRRSSLDWMRRWLMDEPPNGMASADYAALDKSFDAKTSDMGLAEEDVPVVPGGNVMDLPGERSVYDVLVDMLLGESAPRLVFRESEAARHRFYGSKSPAEELSMVCQMLGRSLALDRKEAILSAAREYAAAHGGEKPHLVAEDSWVKPARMAYEEEPRLFAAIHVLGDGRFHGVVRGEALRGEAPPSR